MWDIVIKTAAIIAIISFLIWAIETFAKKQKKLIEANFRGFVALPSPIKSGVMEFVPKDELDPPPLIVPPVK